MGDVKLTVRAIRNQAKITQEEMAKKLGITLSTYNRKEMGKSEWKLKEAYIISRECGVPLEWIMEAK